MSTKDSLAKEVLILVKSVNCGKEVALEKKNWTLRGSTLCNPISYTSHIILASGL